MIDLDKIVSERLAILGGTGSGKSYTARGLVERVLAAKGRVGIIDPTGVWWGLRLGPSGKKPSGHDVVVFGGDRGDVPLVETGGRVVAQAVAGSSQSWIVDTSALKTKAAERRFMTEFLDGLFEFNRADITLVVDEADRFSPQRMSPETTRLHERMEEIVRRGRVRGFTAWLITQRPASLNKDVLSMATAYICMRMTGAHDRKAIADALEGQGDKPTVKAIVDAMPRHKTGSGMVWAPQRDILAPVGFPAIETFDSMRPLSATEKHATEKLPLIDIGALREKLVTVEVEAKANDPKALRAEVAKLKGELAKKLPTQSLLPDTRALTAEYERGFNAGWSDADSRWVGRMNKIGEQLKTTQEAIRIPLLKPKFAPVTRGVAYGSPTTSGLAARITPLSHQPFAPSPAARPIVQSGTNGSLPKAERLILTVLAQHGEVPVERVAAIAGYAVKGGGFNNALGALRSKGYIQGLKITDAGLEALGAFEPLPTGEELLRYWMGRVGRAERCILEAAGRGLSDKESIAREAGYEPTGGGFNNALGRLRTLGLISGRGLIELHEDLR